MKDEIKTKEDERTHAIVMGCGAVYRATTRGAERLPAGTRLVVWFNRADVNPPKHADGRTACCPFCPAKKKDSKIKIERGWAEHDGNEEPGLHVSCVVNRVERLPAADGKEAGGE